MPKSNKKQPTGDYNVGYCKPPVPTRWSPGQSGNPKGRRENGAIDLLGCVGRALKRRVSIPLDGKSTRMRVEEALVHKLVAEAARGKPTALRELFKLMSFTEQLERVSGDRTIVARLVLEDEGQEETRAQWLAKDNDELREEIEELKARLEGRSVSDGKTS